MICNLATALSTVHTVNCADVSYPAHPVGIRCLSNFAIVLQQRDAKTDEFASKALKNPFSHLLLRGEKCKTQYALGRNMQHMVPTGASDKSCANGYQPLEGVFQEVGLF